MITTTDTPRVITAVVHPRFDASWPFAVRELRALAPAGVRLGVVRLPVGSRLRLGELAAAESAVASADNLLCLGVEVTPGCLVRLPHLARCWFDAKGKASDEVAEILADRGIANVVHRDKGYYADSVSEFALALTLCALRRIPLMDRSVRGGARDIWTGRPPRDGQEPGLRGEQFADDPCFTHGTLRGKRVSVVGLGNIGARFASMASHLGAHVAAYDPNVDDLRFRLVHARRAVSMVEIAQEAEVFAPMLPRTDLTEGVVDADVIASLQAGCVVVLATRAGICDMGALRQRVERGELFLAADVFDREPLAENDPLLALDNVILTPHLAGRTLDSNRSWAQAVWARWAEVLP